MKKKILFITILLVALLYVPNALAVNITGCNALLDGVEIDVKIANAVHTVITVIKIAVPVLLVVFGMLDLVKGIIASKEDEIKKGQSILIKRLITAVLIFFIASLVQLIVSFVASFDDEPDIMTCANCFINGADKNTGKCN